MVNRRALQYLWHESVIINRLILEREAKIMWELSRVPIALHNVWNCSSCFAILGSNFINFVRLNFGVCFQNQLTIRKARVQLSNFKSMFTNRQKTTILAQKQVVPNRGGQVLLKNTLLKADHFPGKFSSLLDWKIFYGWIQVVRIPS